MVYLSKIVVVGAFGGTGVLVYGYQKLETVALQTKSNVIGPLQDTLARVVD